MVMWKISTVISLLIILVNYFKDKRKDATYEKCIIVKKYCEGRGYITTRLYE